MKVLILIIAIWFSSNLFCQTKINGRIDNYIHRDVNICTQFGDNSKIIATVKTNHNGEMNFTLNDYEKGLYRLYLDNEEFFDLILTNEDIEFATKAENPMYNMLIFKSKENSQLYYFYIKNNTSEYKIRILKQLTDIYPEGNFLSKVQKELLKETKLKNDHLKKAIKINKNSFAGRYLSYFYEPPVNAKYNEYEKNEYLKNNYLKFFNFNDVEMLNSDAYQKVIFNYFKLYRSNNSENMYKAAKSILTHIADKNQKIFSIIFEYILEGFDVMGLSEKAAKLSIEFGERCSDDDESLNLRIANSINLSIGKKAPDFTAISLQGQEISLSKSNSDYTLLIFWATWCDHCKYLFPRLLTAENLFKNANIQVITVSLDSNKESLEKFINDNKISWPVICDYKSWDNEIVKNYSIYATPFMIIIDKDLTIKAKPFNDESLFNFIEKIIK